MNTRTQERQVHGLAGLARRFPLTVDEAEQQAPAPTRQPVVA